MKIPQVWAVAVCFAIADHPEPAVPEFVAVIVTVTPADGVKMGLVPTFSGVTVPPTFDAVPPM